MLHIELLSFGDFLQHYSSIDVSFLATTYKNIEVLNFDPFFIKNTLDMDIKNISESPCKLVQFYNCKLCIINNISSLPFNSRFILLEVYSDNHVSVDSSRITQIDNNECKKYSKDNLHVFLWKYGKKGNVEQVFKYMLMPYLLTILQIFITLFAFYNLDNLLGDHIFGHFVFDIMMSILISFLLIFYSYFLFNRSSLETSSVIVQHMNNVH